MADPVPSPLTDTELNAIEKRVNEASPAPWACRYNWFEKNTEGAAYGVTGPSETEIEIGYEEDAEFIAHAREDVPALVESLRSERALRVSLDTENEKLREEIRAYAATVEALEDPERAAVLLADTFDPNDFVEAERPVRPGRYGDHTKGQML